MEAIINELYINYYVLKESLNLKIFSLTNKNDDFLDNNKMNDLFKIKGNGFEKKRVIITNSKHGRRGKRRRARQYKRYCKEEHDYTTHVSLYKKIKCRFDTAFNAFINDIVECLSYSTDEEVNKIFKKVGEILISIALKKVNGISFVKFFLENLLKNVFKHIGDVSLNGSRINSFDNIFFLLSGLLEKNPYVMHIDDIFKHLIKKLSNTTIKNFIDKYFSYLKNIKRPDNYNEKYQGKFFEFNIMSMNNAGFIFKQLLFTSIENSDIDIQKRELILNIYLDLYPEYFLTVNKNRYYYNNLLNKTISNPGNLRLLRIIIKKAKETFDEDTLRHYVNKSFTEFDNRRLVLDHLIKYNPDNEERKEMVKLLRDNGAITYEEFHNGDYWTCEKKEKKYILKFDIESISKT